MPLRIGRKLGFMEMQTGFIHLNLILHWRFPAACSKESDYDFSLIFFFMFPCFDMPASDDCSSAEAL